MAVGAILERIALAGASFDSAKLEYEPGTDSTRALLKSLLQWTDSFTTPGDFGHLTEDDTGTNVEVSGGLLKVTGSNAWDSNGAHLTSTVLVATPGKFTIKFTPKGALGYMVIKTAVGTTLDYNDGGLGIYTHSNGVLYVQQTGGLTHKAAALSLDTEYTLTLEWTAGKYFTVTLDGGAYSNTLQGSLQNDAGGNNVGFQINAYSAFGDQWEFDDFKLYQGYATDDPVFTLADLDAGVNDAERDFSTVVFSGDTTGLEFSVAFGNSPSPTNWTSFFDYSTLLAQGTKTGRYLRFRIKVSSDGATQRELTEGAVSTAVSTAGGDPGRGTLAVSRPDEDTVRLTYTKPVDPDWVAAKLYADRGGDWTLLHTFSDSGTHDDDVTALFGRQRYIAVSEGTGPIYAVKPCALAEAFVAHPTADWPTVRGHIKTLLEAVSGIGKVHEYRRHTTQWKAFYDEHKSSGKVNNWEITRRSESEEVAAVEAAAGNEPLFHDTWNVRIIGHMSVKDSATSEHDFQNLIDAIVAKFRVNNLLGGRVILPRQIQAPTIEHRTFAGVLVHYCELDFEAIVRIVA